MKKRGYNIRIEKDHVSVEHRPSGEWLALAIVLLIYFGYLLSDQDARNVFLDLFAKHDLAAALALLLYLLFPLAAILGWLFYASGELMRCDAKEFRFAKRRLIGRWHRFRFSSKEVQGLCLTYRSRGKSGYYVLTFQCIGHSYDIMPNIDRPDANRILAACRSLGINAPIDPASHMIDDIDKRGWLVNPWKNDRDEHPSTKQ